MDRRPALQVCVAIGPYFTYLVTVIARVEGSPTDAVVDVSNHMRIPSCQHCGDFGHWAFDCQGKLRSSPWVDHMVDAPESETNEQPLSKQSQLGEEDKIQREDHI